MKNERVQLRPFLWVGLAWLGLGTGVLLLPSAGAEDGAAIRVSWFLLFWLLGMLDLAILAGLVLSMVSWQGASDRLRMGTRVLILGILKVALLLIFGAILFLRHGIPTSSLLLGLGTLIVVPLLGGLGWSFRSAS